MLTLDWTERTNQQIIEHVIKMLEQNKNRADVYTYVRELQLDESEIIRMVQVDINTIIDRWTQYYEYGYVPVNPAVYSERSFLMTSRLSMINAELATKASNSFANLTSQLFRLTEDGTVTRSQAIRVLKDSYAGNTVTYANGTEMPIKAYLETVFRTELGNVTRDRAFEVAESIGTNVYEMSSRADAYDRCVHAQGGYICFGTGETSIVIRTSNGKQSFPVRDVVAKDRYGEADALGGIGCRHTWVPRQDGVSSNKTIVRNTNYFIDEE